MKKSKDKCFLNGLEKEILNESIQKSNDDNQILVGTMVDYNNKNIYSYYLE